MDLSNGSMSAILHTFVGGGGEGLEVDDSGAEEAAEAFDVNVTFEPITLEGGAPLFSFKYLFGGLGAKMTFFAWADEEEEEEDEKIGLAKSI